nr:hypothetical protein [Leptolyngbyaceae cyanobacterium MO_188.B28]
MFSHKSVSQQVEAISNSLKPIVRPGYSWLVLNPAIKFLLGTTTVEKEYGRHHKILRLPPETIPTPEVKSMPTFDAPFKYLEGETYT